MTSLSDLTVELGRAFLVWWWDTLLSMVPRDMRKRLLANRKQIFVRLDGNRAHFFKVDGEDIISQDSAGLKISELVGAVSSILGVNRTTPSRVVLRVKENTILRHNLTLPRMSKHDLRAALALQMDRLSPTTSADTIFDFQATIRKSDPDQLDVDVVLCPFHVVEPHIQLLQEAGLTITEIEIEDTSGIPLPGFRLSHRLNRPARMFSPFDWMLAGTAVAGLLSTLYLPIYKRSEALDSLSQNLSAARSQALAATELQDQISEITEDTNFLSAERSQSLAIIAGLDELSKVLPDNTWLNELRIQNNIVVVRGFSNEAAAVVPAIGDSPHFATPTFTAPVTTQEQTQLEQFSLSFHLKGGSI